MTSLSKALLLCFPGVFKHRSKHLVADRRTDGSSEDPLRRQTWPTFTERRKHALLMSNELLEDLIKCETGRRTDREPSLFSSFPWRGPYFPAYSRSVA